MTINANDYGLLFWEGAGFTVDQAAALKQFAEAVITDDKDFRNEIFVSGTGQFLKWSGVAADYPNVTP